MTQIGWQVKPSDTPELKDMRGFIFLALGVAARDAETATKAREMTEAYMANPSSVDPSLVGRAFQVAAFNGDPKLYDEFVKQMEAAKSPGEHNRYMRALSEFRDPALLQRTLKLATTDEIRSQDAPRVITGVMRNPAGRELAWQFVRSNWDAVKKKSSVWSAATFVNAAAVLCESQKSGEIQQFFQTAQLPGAERTLRQSVERNDECSQFRQTQQPALANYLEKSGGEHAGASLR